MSNQILILQASALQMGRRSLAHSKSRCPSIRHHTEPQVSPCARVSCLSRSNLWVLLVFTARCFGGLYLRCRS